MNSNLEYIIQDLNQYSVTDLDTLYTFYNISPKNPTALLQLARCIYNSYFNSSNMNSDTRYPEYVYSLEHMEGEYMNLDGMSTAVFIDPKKIIELVNKYSEDESFRPISVKDLEELDVGDMLTVLDGEYMQSAIYKRKLDSTFLNDKEKKEEKEDEKEEEKEEEKEDENIQPKKEKRIKGYVKVDNSTIGVIYSPSSVDETYIVVVVDPDMLRGLRLPSSGIDLRNVSDFSHEFKHVNIPQEYYNTNRKIYKNIAHFVKDETNYVLVFDRIDLNLNNNKTAVLKLLAQTIQPVVIKKPEKDIKKMKKEELVRYLYSVLDLGNVPFTVVESPKKQPEPTVVESPKEQPQHEEGPVMYKGEEVGTYNVERNTFSILYEHKGKKKLMVNLPMDFNKETARRLKDVATALKIEGRSTMKKKDLVKHLEENIVFV